MQAALSPNQIGERGRAIYEEGIQATVRDEHLGKLILIDIESGDYEIDEDDIAAEEKLLARRPNAVMYLMRVGNVPAWIIGGKAL